MKSIIKHFRRWNIWRKKSLNGCIHKLFVLFRIIRSPTFEQIMLPEELDEIRSAVEKRVQETAALPINWDEVRAELERRLQNGKTD